MPLAKLKNWYSKFRSKVSHKPLQRLYRRRKLLSAYKKGLAELPFPPEYLQLDVSAHCNLSCIMCPQSVENGMSEKGLMELDLYKRVVDDAARSRIFSILLVLTGEPLINKNLFEMIRYGKKKGMRVHMSTNCTLMTRDVSRKLIESGLDEIILSFDSAQKDLYESYRRGADYDSVLKNIIDFFELRSELRSRTPFAVMQNLQKFNPDKHVPTIEEDFRQLFAPYDVWIMPKYFSNWSGIMNDNEELYAESGMSDDREYQLCLTLYQRFVVSFDGTVVSCCNDFRREQVMGNLQDSSILEIWNNRAYKEMRENIARKQYERHSLCRNCGALWK